MHVQKLRQLPSVTKDKAPNLRLLINEINTHKHGLQVLSLNVNSQELWIMILERMDPETHRSWGLNTASSPDIPSLKTSKNPDNYQARRHANPMTIINSAKASRQRFNCNFTTQAECLRCKGSHVLHKCDKLRGMQPNQRHSFVKQNKVCFNCLKPNVA